MLSFFLVRLTCLSTFTNFPIMLWSSVSDVAALATYGSFLGKSQQFHKIIASVLNVQGHSKLEAHAHSTMVLIHAAKA